MPGGGRGGQGDQQGQGRSQVPLAGVERKPAQQGGGCQQAPGPQRQGLIAIDDDTGTGGGQDDHQRLVMCGVLWVQTIELTVARHACSA